MVSSADPCYQVRREQHAAPNVPLSHQCRSPGDSARAKDASARVSSFLSQYYLKVLPANIHAAESIILSRR